MKPVKKITVDLQYAEQKAVERIRAEMAKSQGRASISDAVRRSLLKTAKELSKS